MAAQSKVNLEKCALLKCLCWEWKLNSSSLQDRWRHRSAHLLLKYSLVFAHTDKSNTYFESVKTLRLFVCTHNNNKTLLFCKTMKANRMRFLPSPSLWTRARNSVHTCLTDMKNISIESEMFTFKWTTLKTIFSDYVMCMKHAHMRVHYCADDESVSVSPTSSLNPKTKKAFVYQIIKMLMQPPYCFYLTHS